MKTKMIMIMVGLLLVGGCDAGYQERMAQRKVRNRRSISQMPGWSDVIKDIILKEKLQVGMTENQVRWSWRNKKLRNYSLSKSIGSWGVHEQWCSPMDYYSRERNNGTICLYLENGILTAWQEF